MRLLVLGASGGCGRWLCRLGMARSHAMTALVRPKTAFVPPAGVRVIRGEVLDEATLAAALSGHDAVACCLGIKRRSPLNPWSALVSPPDLCTRVAATLVRIAPGAGVHRVVAISAAGVGDSRDRTSLLVRWMIDHTHVADSYRDLAAMERTFRESPLNWCAVRPVTLVEAGAPAPVGVAERYGLATRVRRSGVAGFMLDTLETLETDPPIADRTPMIASTRERG